MDIEKALEYTEERLNSLNVDKDYTERENELIKETIEYLTFIKVTLTNIKVKGE